MAYSDIENGVLWKFDERDLKNGCYKIPNGVKEIFQEAFKGCKDIVKIEFPEGLQVIGEKAFEGCSNINNIILPDSVTEIGRNAFSACISASKIKLSKNLKVISFGSFNGVGVTELDIPEGVEKLESFAFSNNTKLNKVIIPSTVLEFGVNAFDSCDNLETVELKEGLKALGERVFIRCGNLKHVNIPASLEKVDKSCFWGCNQLSINCPSISLKNVKVLENFMFPSRYNKNPLWTSENVVISEPDLNEDKVFTKEEFIKNIPLLKSNVDFLKYAWNYNKRLPKNIGIIKSTPSDRIENFYSYMKDWIEIINEYSKQFKNQEGVTEQMVSNATTSLYQLSIALGLFEKSSDSSGKKSVSNKAKTFIKENILKYSLEDMHKTFNSFNTRTNGYKEEFAKFFMINYREAKEENELPFLHKYNEYSKKVLNYTASTYNDWDKVRQAYPNKQIVSMRVTGSDYIALHEQEVLDVVSALQYENVLPGNEEFAELVGMYGYTQEAFGLLQKWWEESKAIPQKELKLFIGRDKADKGVRFNFLSKKDARSVILGELSSCCQVVNNAGAECLHYGMVKPNSGFVAFTLDNQFVGQSWVWYNKKTKTVCLDNIELNKGTNLPWKSDPRFVSSFAKCLNRLSESIIEEMAKNGLEVNSVVVGSQCTKVKALAYAEKIKVDKSVLPSDYHELFVETNEGLHSDAEKEQYVISEGKFKDYVESLKKEEIATV